ncbi:carboxylating nicotinate-nucleotide diphosphorylase [Candidatus Nitrosacidococcus tergens]|uniref:Probable nicotinate-nucleotide pyrophosphorylase [carboxylating] n=1 Tax=Candidatus Nitrosacidococcus tergens TaxID=553981 RepID=A0A7G1Q9G0_9GAMM|nr:carboxylating nicotinate-nucleotide diphosphorylase [Candidatus Nitrosacidococcus tergens]CAB1275709.1 quinolinate phosphoribosyltransferase [Candidatus Nitrosacidococcus tergens]
MNNHHQNHNIEAEVRQALAEDIGSGDITTSLIKNTATVKATVISREPGILCGIPWFSEAFRQLDSNIMINWMLQDGDSITANQIICTLFGSAVPILTGERTGLNFLQTLSSTATIAHAYATAILGLPTKILDTRKTIPGLRNAQKYAVRCGGCHNHRYGLYDGILIKENHILAAGSITQAIQQAKRNNPKNLPIETEVENLIEFQEALDAVADIILLDDFQISDLIKAVELNQKRAKLEASGGINLGNVRQVAETGVDYISIGALTKDIKAIDLSMRFQYT